MRYLKAHPDNINICAYSRAVLCYKTDNVYGLPVMEMILNHSNTLTIIKIEAAEFPQYFLDMIPGHHIISLAEAQLLVSSPEWISKEPNNWMKDPLYFFNQKKWSIDAYSILDFDAETITNYLASVGVPESETDLIMAGYNDANAEFQMLGLGV